MKIYTLNGRNVCPQDAKDLIIKQDRAPLKTIVIESAEGFPLIVRNAINPLAKFFPEMYSPVSRRDYIITLEDKKIIEFQSKLWTMEDVLFGLKIDAKLEKIPEETVMTNIMRFKTDKEDIAGFMEQLLKEGFKYEKALDSPLPNGDELYKKIIGKIEPIM